SFQNLRGTASRFGNREALVAAHQDYRATYDELAAQCEEVARGLMARGVKKGDRVGIWSPNRYEWVIVQYATSAMGAILVNINPAYRTSELEYALNQSGISFLILAARFRQADYLALLVALWRAHDVHRRTRAPSLPGLRLHLAPDRDHGRLAVSRRGDEEGPDRDAHPRDDDRVRHDRNVACIHPVHDRRPARAPRI